MKDYIVILLVVISIFLLNGCGRENSKDSHNNQIDVEFGKNDYVEVVSSNNALGFKILSEIKKDVNENVFFSPTSLMMALPMVYNGAEGATKKEIGKILQAEGIVETNDLNKANASLLSMLDKGTKQIELNIANSIWLHDHYHFQDDFARNTKDYYHAEIKELNFAENETPKQINNWVKHATNNKIDKMVDSPLDKDLVSILINAIYFNGNWKYEFDKNLTEDKEFFSAGGSNAAIIPFMTLHEELAYIENELFQAVMLPYGNEEVSMKVFLPNESVHEHDFEEALTYDNWVDWNEDFRKKEGTIMLPKFSVEYEVELNEALKSLGMLTAFDKDHADFSHMIKEEDPLWISLIKQKAYTDINEKGTEAAAATSVEMKTTSAPVDGPFFMNVNRPFFIAITDNETDTILFMGWIVNPSPEKR